MAGKAGLASDSMFSFSNWVSYVKRFLRHYRHRRQAGYSVAHAVESTRTRMQEPYE